jgi:riboflavin kinase/FMN adenylyltransferase
MITSLEHRLRLLDRLGLDMCLLVKFTSETASMTAREFVNQILCDTLHVRRVILGYDCRFGRDREGDSQFCRKMGKERNFSVETVSPVRSGGEIVSSTAIRRAVSRGDVQHAATLLGRPYSLFGHVVHGDGRGHTLGWPTANLNIEGELMPAYAVYAGMAQVEGEKYPAVISVGTRSTFHPSDEAEPVVEAHILEDIPEELYGKEVEVELYRWLRPQQQFDSAHELGEQIRRDVEDCRRVLQELRESEEIVTD